MKGHGQLRMRGQQRSCERHNLLTRRGGIGQLGRLRGRGLVGERKIERTKRIGGPEARDTKTLIACG